MTLTTARSDAVLRILEALGLKHRHVKELHISIAVDRVATVGVVVERLLDEQEADALADNLPALAPEVTVDQPGIGIGDARFAMLRDILTSHGCPWPDGGHIPTVVGEWLQSLQQGGSRPI